MKKQNTSHFIVVCILVCIAVSVAILLLTKPAPTNKDATYPTINDGESKYAAAIERIDQTEDICYTVSYKKDMLVGNEYLSEQTQQEIRFISRNTTNFRGLVKESFNIGDHTVSVTELYADNTGYFTVDTENFIGAITQADYIGRYIPAVLLDKNLYADINGYATDDGYQIAFQRPSAPESWSQCDIHDLVSGVGTAYLDPEGNLTKSTYLLSYTVGDVSIRLSVTVQINSTKAESIPLPTDLSTYTKLTYLDGPRMLERASGYLLGTDNLKSHYTDTIRCEAFGDVRHQSMDMTISNSPSWSAQIKTQVTMENTGKTGFRSILTQTEEFHNGQYTITTNSDNAAVKDVDINTMRSHCRDLLVGSILLPQYISQATVTEDESTYRIEYSASENFAQLIVAEACQTLYQNANVLSDYAQDYSTEKIICYLTINKSTGLPQSSGFSYRGTYTINTITYPLEYTAEQSYSIMNSEAGTS